MVKRFVVVLATLGLVACGSPDDSSEGDESTDVPGFRQLHGEIFASSCAQDACHSGVGIAGLSFDDVDAAYEHLIGGTPVNGVAATNGMALVRAGDPDGSFLLAKLTTAGEELAAMGMGAAMPVGALQVPGPNSVEAIRNWIAAGAPMDGVAFEADFTDSMDDHYIDCPATDAAGMEACFGPAPDPTKVLRLFTPPITVPAGADISFCTNIDFIAPTNILAKEVRGAQMRGGHHAGLFSNVLPSDDFVAAECPDDMSNLRYVAGAGGAGGTYSTLPPGVALRMSVGTQAMIQSHYINPGTEPIVVMDMVELVYTTEEESPVIVDPFAIIQASFEIPPHAKGYSAETICEIDRPLDIYMLLGHTHENGVNFDVNLQPVGGGPEQLLYHATDGKLLRSNPEIKNYSDPMHFQVGDKLRVTCTWDNDTDAPIGWPEEMCVSLMYYGPGEGWLTCDQSDGTPQGGTSDPGDETGCVAEGTPGNEIGAGEYCTAGGGECADNSGAKTCLADFDSRANFCSIVGCDSDADCGAGVTCVDQGAADVCTPPECM